MSEAALQRSASPTKTGTICEGFGITGRPAAESACLVEHGLALMLIAPDRAILQELHGRLRRRGDGRRQGGGEDEGGRIRAHRIDDRAIRGNIAAERAKTFGERALDDIDFVHHAVAFGNAAAARAIKADRMDLVHIGHRMIAMREIGDLANRRNIAMHGIKALEGDELRPLFAGGLQKLFEMSEIIVAENLPLGAGALDALDHRIVIILIRKNQAVGQKRADRAERGEIGNPA